MRCTVVESTSCTIGLKGSSCVYFAGQSCHLSLIKLPPLPFLGQGREGHTHWAMIGLSNASKQEVTVLLVWLQICAKACLWGQLDNMHSSEGSLVICYASLPILSLSVTLPSLDNQQQR